MRRSTAASGRMIRRVSWWVLYMVCLPQALAQTALLSADDIDHRSQVQGVVTDGATGMALPGASLWLSPQGSANSETLHAVSDSSGHFVFAPARPGHYKIESEVDGYPLQMYPRTLNLTAGRNTDGIGVRLLAGGVISGQVLGVEGQPLVKAEVEATTDTERSRKGRRLRVGIGWTDDKGNYRISGLEAGQYCVVAVPPTGPGALAAANGAIYVPTVYPGERKPDEFVPLAVRLGDLQGGVDFNLIPVQPCRLAGRVINGLTHEPVPSATIKLQSSNPVLRVPGVHPRPTRADAKGQFTIEGVPPGEYALTCSQDANRTALYGELTLDLGEGQELKGIQLVVDVLPKVSGKVTTDAAPDRNFRSLRIRFDTIASDSEFTTALADIHPDGTFVVPDLLPGRYGLTVESVPPPYFLRSAVIDGEDVLQDGITVYQGMDRPNMAIILGSNGGVISGAAVREDGSLASGATVVLIPDPPRRLREDLYKSTPTDGVGQFRIAGVAPGEYEIFVWQKIGPEVYKDPGFVGQIENLGTRVEVEEGEEQNIQLRMREPSVPPS